MTGNTEKNGVYGIHLMFIKCNYREVELKWNNTLPFQNKN